MYLKKPTKEDLRFWIRFFVNLGVKKGLHVQQYDEHLAEVCLCALMYTVQMKLHLYPHALSTVCTYHLLYTPIQAILHIFPGLSPIRGTQKQFVQETATWCLHCA